jgi:hypothetical protein
MDAVEELKKKVAEIQKELVQNKAPSMSSIQPPSYDGKSDFHGY